MSGINQAQLPRLAGAAFTPAHLWSSPALVLQCQERRVDVEVLTPRLDFLEEAFGCESFQVDGGGLTLGDVRFVQVADPAAGMHEDQFRQLPGADPRHPLSNRGARLVEKLPDRADFRRRPFRRCSDSLQKEEYPCFPVLLRRHLQQMPVVKRLVPDDVPAEIEGGNFEQVLVDEIEQVQHASGAADSVDERVDRSN